MAVVIVFGIGAAVVVEGFFFRSVPQRGGVFGRARPEPPTRPFGSGRRRPEIS